MFIFSSFPYLTTKFWYARGDLLLSKFYLKNTKSSWQGTFNSLQRKDSFYCDCEISKILNQWMFLMIDELLTLKLFILEVTIRT